MPFISLTKGFNANVDDQDFKLLSKFRWQVFETMWANYAQRFEYKGSRKKKIFMHREILGLEHNDGKFVDHINKDGLNNCRSNLRLCTLSQNSANRGKQKNGKASMFKGVFSSGLRKKQWYSKVNHQGKTYNLGYFLTEQEAALAYDKKAEELFGEFAFLNFKLPQE